MAEWGGALLVLLGVALWLAFCGVYAHLGGWRDLATLYRATDQAPGRRWRLESASLRWPVSYKYLTVAADESGLHLSTLFYLRPGHPPLFIRWHELSVTRKKGLFSSSFDFRCRAVPEVRIVLEERLTAQVREAAGWSWPLERQAA
jgi:hypothetical protein